MSDVKDLFQKERQAWLLDCQAAARKLLRTRLDITIEDVLEVCPRPSYIHKNTTGSVFRHDDFVAFAFAKARKPSSHSRYVMRWRLSDDARQATLRQVRRARQPEMSE
jgi:hypothetical protein